MICNEEVAAGGELDGQGCADAIEAWYVCLASAPCATVERDCERISAGFCEPCPSLC